MDNRNIAIVACCFWVSLAFAFCSNTSVFFGTFASFVVYTLGMVWSKELTLFIYWFVQYLFLAIAPSILTSSRVLSNSPIIQFAEINLNGDYLPAFIPALIFNLFFSLGIFAFKNSSLKRSSFGLFFFKALNYDQFWRMRISRSLLYLILFLSGCLISFLSVREAGGILNMFLPRYVQSQELISVRTIYSLVGRCILATNIIIYVGLLKGCSVSHRISSIERSCLIFYTTISLFLLLIVCNPVSNARFDLLITWLPVVIVFFPYLWSKIGIFLSSMIALYFIFPVLSVISRNEFASYDIYELVVETMNELATNISKYADVFSVNSAFSIFYNQLNLPSLGDNLVLLFTFFIPRAFWTSKPTLLSLDLGGFLYSSELTGTDNLSFPIYNEFFGDFGYIGLFLGGFMLSFLLMCAINLSKQIFSFGKSRNSQLSLTSYGQLQLAAAIPILSRGPVPAILSSSFIYFIWLTLLAFLFSIISKLSSK